MAIVRGVRPHQCSNMGGTAVNCRVQSTPGSFNTGFGDKICDCYIPDAPKAAPSITVSPVIATQVSPQISPVFQQQFQPTDSPATAGTVQTVPQVQAQAPVPQYAAPVQSPPPQAAVPTYIPPEPAPIPEVPAPIPTPGFDWKMAAILGAGLIGGMVLTGKQKR